jgi:hypothetical protein
MVDIDRAQGQKMIKLLEEISRRSKKEAEDFSAKFSRISTFVLSVIVALVGLYFTTVYSNRETQRNQGARSAEGE